LTANYEASQPDSPLETKQSRSKFDFTSLNTLAVVSLAAAVSGVGALIAIITGHVALAQIKRSGENGRLLAIVGTVLGYAHIAGWVIFGILALATKVMLYSGMTGWMPFMPGFMSFFPGFDGMPHWGR
jgi:hypothetical protein